MTSAADRELLQLTNNGTARIRLEDRSTETFFDFKTGENSFDIENQFGLVPFRIAQGTLDNALTLSLAGVGINAPIPPEGTSFPDANLHIRQIAGLTGLLVESDLDSTQTRNMIEVVNNGPMIQQFVDTSTAEPSVYQIEARSDRFSVLQLGNNRAGFAIFEDGIVRFVANGQPQIAVTPAGSLNIVGSAVGGGNLSVGLGPNIGPDDGNIFATGNIMAQGNISCGGELNCPSDVNIKEGFEEIDPKEILRKVKNLPITRWNYIQDENDTDHVGPMAQDFAAAFEVGTSDKHISTIDSDGISLAAIKGLSLIMDEKDTTISAQADEIAELKSELEDIKAELGERSESISELMENFKELKEKVSALN